MNSPINILLVDDNRRNLEVLETVLAAPELRLVHAMTPDEALLQIVNESFACIVLDVQMPGTNGYELARMIKTRKRSQQIPIIFITAFLLEKADILQGYGAGAVDYLTRPIDPQILKSKVGVFVDLYRTARALTSANGALQLEITQRRKAEEALREANSKLEQRVQDRVRDLKRVNDDLMAAANAKDNFLATLSHELRTPLNPVLLVASEGAQNMELPDATRADFEVIVKNVELEARLIDDLLDLTRIARGKILLEKKAVDVHAVLRDAVMNVREEIDKKKIVLTLRLLAPQHIVFADSVRLQQVFWNVLRNAVKFTPSGGRIVVETDGGRQKRVMVRVTDTGMGMSPVEIDRLFTALTPGPQIGASAANRFGGLGLGLSISQKLIELHSGKISAVSQGRDKGSTFMIELPVLTTTETVRGDDIRLDATSTPPGARASTKALRILVVEDHEATRTALANMLARRFYQVSTASTLAEARAAANSEHFNLVISDLGLPDGTGYELMTDLKEHGSIPGIALTGYGMAADIARSREAGFIAHLTKPVRTQSLDSALEAAVRSIRDPAHA